MNKTLSTKTALVTGAASGLGKASAIALAKQGVKVAVTDLNTEAAQLVADQIVSLGGTAIALHCDISNEESIRDSIAETVSTFGELNVLHNNAAFTSIEAVQKDTDILSIPTELWDQIMQITLRGTMLGCRYAVKAMSQCGGGSIINTSSMYGVSAFNRMPAYGVSKAAINMLTQYTATAYGRLNIRCNAVAPSMIKTPLLESTIPAELITLNENSTLTPFLGTPEDIANIVVFLASDESRYLTGQIIQADGGTTAHLPTYSEARKFFGE